MASFRFIRFCYKRRLNVSLILKRPFDIRESQRESRFGFLLVKVSPPDWVSFHMTKSSGVTEGQKM